MINAEQMRNALVHALYDAAELGPEPRQMPAGAIKATGVLSDFALHPERLEAARPLVLDAIAQLDPAFLKGWSFLNLPVDAHGDQWGEHQDAEALLVLAGGLGLARVLLPRKFWDALPGGMPYVQFTREAGQFAPLTSS